MESKNWKKILEEKWFAEMLPKIRNLAANVRGTLYGLFPLRAGIGGPPGKRKLNNLLMLYPFGELVGLPILPPYRRGEARSGTRELHRLHDAALEAPGHLEDALRVPPMCLGAVAFALGGWEEEAPERPAEIARGDACRERAHLQGTAPRNPPPSAPPCSGYARPWACAVVAGGLGTAGSLSTR